MERRLKSLSRIFQKNFNSYLKKHFNHFKLENKKTRSTLLLIGSFAAINLIFSLFSIYTVVSFTIMMGTFLTFLHLIQKKISEKGLADWCSPTIQQILLHRSLFDIICDIWFIPDVLRYFRVFLLPFFVKIEPEEAINQLEELSPKAKKVILQKGLVHLLPQFVSKMFVSQRQSSFVQRSFHFSNENQQESGDEINQSPRHSPSSGDRQDQQTVEKKRVSFAPSHSEEPRNNNFRFKRPKEIISVRHNKKELILPKEKKFNGIPNLRSEIHQENLFSRHSGNQNHHQSAISQKWDKLEAFLTKKSEEKLKKKSLPQETPKKLEFRDYLDAFQGFTMFLSKDQFLSNINSRKLTMIFLISSISLIVQLMLSKKARKWCYYTLKIIGYIIGFSLSTGSLSLLAIKLHHRYKNKKKIKQELDSCSIEDSDA